MDGFPQFMEGFPGFSLKLGDSPCQVNLPGGDNRRSLQNPRTTTPAPKSLINTF